MTRGFEVFAFQELLTLNRESHVRISQFQKEKKELEKGDNEIRTRKKDLQAIKTRKKTLENNIQIKLKSWVSRAKFVHTLPWVLGAVIAGARVEAEAIRVWKYLAISIWSTARILRLCECNLFFKFYRLLYL